MTYLLENAAFSEEFHSFIAVKRGEPEYQGGEDSSDHRHFAELARMAGKRAVQIAALVSLAVLADSDRWRTCGLVEQVHGDQVRSLAMIAPETSGFYYQTGRGSSRTIRSSGNVVSLSREQLLAKIWDQRMASLAGILTPQRAPIGGSLARAVSEAAIRLADAVHSASAAGQLLGAVTAMEILVSNQGDSYDLLRRRLTILVGESAFTAFEGDRVLSERHLYVHRGMEPGEDFAIVKATALALCSLLTYAEAAPGFPTKSSLLTYLDFLEMGRRMEELWDEADQNAFSRFVKHRAENCAFPYFVNSQDSPEQTA